MFKWDRLSHGTVHPNNHFSFIIIINLFIAQRSQSFTVSKSQSLMVKLVKLIKLVKLVKWSSWPNFQVVMLSSWSKWSSWSSGQVGQVSQVDQAG